MALDDAENFDRGRNACRRFTLSYRFDGRTWDADVWAATREEAEMKARAMARGTISGEVIATFEDNHDSDRT